MPLEGGYGLPFLVVGRPLRDGPFHGGGGWLTVSPGYFEVFRIPVKRGRAFTDRDTAASPAVVMINEAMNVVAALDYDKVGEVVLLKELLEGGDRALVVGHGDEESVVRLASRLQDGPIRSGDSLLIDRRVHFAYERVPKLEVEELVLEEVPDIDYSVIGGLSSQIDAIRDAVELPFLPLASGPELLAALMPYMTSAGAPG